MKLLENLPENIKDYCMNQKEDLLDGYIRFLDEAGAEEVFEIVRISRIWKGGIPFATTAFGDVFVWCDGFIVLYRFAEADQDVILSGTAYFFVNVNDTEYQEDFFDIGLYQETVNLYGNINDTECFTLEPVPALGGARELQYIHIGDRNTYLQMLIALS